MPVQKIPLSTLKNQPNGVAGLDATGKVTAPIRGRVSILDHGADPTGVADCSAALAAAMAVYTQGTGYYISGPEIEFPPGVYNFASEINLKKTVKLVGAGSGLTGGQPTVLTFPPDSRGIIVNRYNTMGSGVEGVPTTAADGAVVQGISIRGGGTNSLAHGVVLRARATIRDCIIDGFGGNGLHIVAHAGGSPDVEGNANLWRVDSLSCQGNGEWGVYVDGPDANAGTGIGIDCSANGSGGIFDSSFLGNTYIGCHTAGNGDQGAGKNITRNRTSLVWYSGMRYYADRDATPQQLIETTPGSNSLIWRPDVVAAGASYTHPEWLPGQSLGRYFVSSQYKTDGLGAKNIFLGCYQEDGYSPSNFVLPTLVLGGAMGSIVGGASVQPTVSAIAFNAPISASSVILNNAGVTALALVTAGDHPSGLGVFSFDGTAGDWITRHAGAGARTPVRYTTDLSTFNGGRPSAVGGGHIRFPRGAFVGQRMVDSGTAPPSTGEAGRGDMRINENAAVGQPSYWQCTTSGVNGASAVWTAGPVL